MTMTADAASSSPTLAELVESIRGRVMTPYERFEQRVSFVYGQMSHNSRMTKDEVRQHLIAIHGCPYHDR